MSFVVLAFLPVSRNHEVALHTPSQDVVESACLFMQTLGDMAANESSSASHTHLPIVRHLLVHSEGTRNFSGSLVSVVLAFLEGEASLIGACEFEASDDV